MSTSARSTVFTRLALAGLLAAALLVIAAPESDAAAAVLCNGEAATMVGTAGADEIEGTSGRATSTRSVAPTRSTDVAGTT